MLTFIKPFFELLFHSLQKILQFSTFRVYISNLLHYLFLHFNCKNVIISKLIVVKMIISEFWRINFFRETLRNVKAITISRYGKV